MDNNTKSKFLKSLLLILVDIVLLNLSAYAAIMLRVEFDLAFARSFGFFNTLRFCALPATLIALFVFRFFNLYSSRWEYAGERELAFLSSTR